VLHTRTGTLSLASADVACLVGPEERVVWWSAGAERATGLPESEARGRRWRELLPTGDLTATVDLHHAGDRRTLIVLGQPPSASRGPAGGLTPRQLEVLALIADGRSARAIGHRLGISEATVRNHIRAVLAELRVHSQVAAVAEARRRGILS
jgi:DNA-binding CsgD family transcriptional regulator